MSMFDSLKKDIMEEVFNEDLQKEIVTALNKNIDIPFISEKTEGKMLDALYSSVEEVLKNAILKG